MRDVKSHAKKIMMIVTQFFFLNKHVLGYDGRKFRYLGKYGFSNKFLFVPARLTEKYHIKLLYIIFHGLLKRKSQFPWEKTTNMTNFVLIISLEGEMKINSTTKISR